VRLVQCLRLAPLRPLSLLLQHGKQHHHQPPSRLQFLRLPLVLNIPCSSLMLQLRLGLRLPLVGNCLRSSPPQQLHSSQRSLRIRAARHGKRTKISLPAPVSEREKQ